MEKRLVTLLDLLDKTEYVTAKLLAEKTKVSDKTVRVRLKELNEIVMLHGAELVSKQRYGYLLVVHDPEKYETWEKSLHNESTQENIPSNRKDREQYLLLFLLGQKNYIKMDQICDFLYISKTVLAADLKKIEKKLSSYQITIDRKPKYGIRIKGQERNIRLCLLDNYLLDNYLLDGGSSILNWNQNDGIVEQLDKIVFQKMEKYHLYFSELEYQNLLMELYVLIKRVRLGFEIEDKIVREDCPIDEEAFHAAQEISTELKKTFYIALNAYEIEAMAVHMAAIRTIRSDTAVSANFIIPEQIQLLVTEMLEHVYNGLKQDLRTNFELRMELVKYLIPFHIRMEYDISIRNTLLAEIKREYLFAYEIAEQSCVPLKLYYKKDISADEIGNLALIFALTLEKMSGSNRKKNILLICASGHGSSQLLAYKYRKEFGEYIDQIKVADAYSLSHIDYTDIDYAFSTVKISQHIPVPVLEVSQFLTEHETNAVTKALKSEKQVFAVDCYKKDLFFSNFEGDTREQVLQNMCKRIGKIIDLPEEFYSYVAKRETLGSTDYGNLIAIPHPYQMLTQETFAAVAVLEHPILWEKQMVQVVILISVMPNQSAKLPEFYEFTANMAGDENAIKELISQPTYEKLIELLKLPH